MHRITVATLDSMECPLCREPLERGAGSQGLVWLCQSCHGGAVTLPILRRHAPRAFVNALWQSALHHGRCSSLYCPACSQPFTEVASTYGGQIRVCIRCYWVWLDSEVLEALASMTVPATLANESASLPPPRRALPAGRRRTCGSSCEDPSGD